MKKNDSPADEKWYDRFYKHPKKSGQARTDRRGVAAAENVSRRRNSAESGSQARGAFSEPRNYAAAPDASAKICGSLFDAAAVPADARAVLDCFDSIVQGIRPMNSRQLARLPRNIRELSHVLTDERERRRLGYMNSTEELSAYVRYFAWWNLVRLSRIFANCPPSAFRLEDGDACLDIGSGPLTAVIALWLARPELRNRRLTWYCLDFSQNALSLGEDVYLSVASRARPSDSTAPSHWEIVRVRGAAGANIRRKAALVMCANLFNEINQTAGQKPDESADRQLEMLLSYMDGRTSLFVCEPGMPSSAHFVSLLRERLIARGFSISLPCPHEGACPMHGKNARFGGSVKWCNFSFTTESAPPALLKLSADAGIPKERAVVSFLLAERNCVKQEKGRNRTDAAFPPSKADAGAQGEAVPLRIASDPIRLPENRTGFYACGAHGLTLVVARSQKQFSSGMMLLANLEKPFSELGRDKKSGAAELVL